MATSKNTSAPQVPRTQGERKAVYKIFSQGVLDAATIVERFNKETQYRTITASEVEAIILDIQTEAAQLFFKEAPTVFAKDLVMLTALSESMFTTAMNTEDANRFKAGKMMLETLKTKMKLMGLETEGKTSTRRPAVEEDFEPLFTVDSEEYRLATKIAIEEGLIVPEDYGDPTIVEELLAKAETDYAIDDNRATFIRDTLRLGNLADIEDVED